MQDIHFAIAFAAGILLHATIFSRHFEWDRHATNILVSASAIFVATVVIIANIEHVSWSLSVSFTGVLTLIFLSDHLGSMIVYRLFLHPLRLFPGPKAARITSLWIIKHNLPDLKLYVKLYNLHDRYGDFVRIRKSRLQPNVRATGFIWDHAKSPFAILML
jgi:hypothetical protein